MTDRKRSYQLALKSPAGEAVMKDLGLFCCGKVTTYREARDLTMLLEGRRQVLLRIQQHLELEAAQLIKLYDDIGDYDA